MKNRGDAENAKQTKKEERTSKKVHEKQEIVMSRVKPQLRDLELLALAL
jgi:hypothetical protein